MIIYFFAFISGLVTIAAPCIWPLLPIVLSSSVTGGRSKSLGITLGVMLSFSVFTLGLSYLLKLIPFDPNILRYLAAGIITILGLTLIIPKLNQLLEGWVSQMSGKIGLRNNQSGFWGGFILGVALGVIWSPCAGPILATIAALSATHAVSFGVVLVTVSYVFGVGIPLFLFSLLGARLFKNSKFISNYTVVIQRIFGVIMIATAILILTNYDKVLEANLLNTFPSFNLSSTFENSSGVQNGLNLLKGPSNLSSLGNAPDFVGVTKWLNLPEGQQSLSLTSLRGKVVLVDFWTYTCINCIRTLPHVTAWYDKYKDQGFVVVGVHTPEFAFEKDTGNVLNAIKQYQIHYPVAQDNNYATWNAYSNEYWPAEYLIDVNGVVRHTHFGEGDYDQTEAYIQTLLKEAGKTVPENMVTLPDQTPNQQISPETYLGSRRMSYLYPNGSVSNGSQNFNPTTSPSINTFTFGGSWTISDEMAQAGAGATIDYHYYASKIFLVMRPSSGGGLVKVYLDGKLINTITIDSDKLYNLIDSKEYDEHRLYLEFSEGIQAFAFTFG